MQFYSIRESINYLMYRWETITDPDIRDAVGSIVRIASKWWIDEAKKMKCSACSGPCPEEYMLKNEAWETVWPQQRGMLCLRCVEDRLGRSLIADDLKDIPMNAAILYFLRRDS